MRVSCNCVHKTVLTTERFYSSPSFGEVDGLCGGYFCSHFKACVFQSKDFEPLVLVLLTEPMLSFEVPRLHVYWAVLRMSPNIAVFVSSVVLRVFVCACFCTMSLLHIALLHQCMMTWLLLSELIVPVALSYVHFLYISIDFCSIGC